MKSLKLYIKNQFLLQCFLIAILVPCVAAIIFPINDYMNYFERFSYYSLGIAGMAVTMMFYKIEPEILATFPGFLLHHGIIIGSVYVLKEFISQKILLILIVILTIWCVFVGMVFSFISMQ